MIALLLCSLASGSTLQLDRVDLLSESPGTWLPYEAPRLATAPGIAALRWVAQVSPVVSYGALEVSASLAAQSVGVRAPLVPRHGVFGDLALVTRAFLPVGARVGLSVRPGPVRLGVSLVAMSDTTWVRADYRSFSVMPAVGFGIGRDVRSRAPWMRD